jgi:Ca-activated chloride channel family protein
MLFMAPFLWFYQVRYRKTSSLVFSSITALKQFSSCLGLVRKHILTVFRMLALILFILALARPQSGTREEVIHTEGIDIILCLDTSGSMKGIDFQLNGKPCDRLLVVKKAAAEFIKGRRSDRIGTVIFGQEAVTICPLTFDHKAILRFLDRIQVGIAGDMTAIGSALALSAKRLSDSPARSQVIVLLTDGISNAGHISPQKATAISRSLGIKVYTIGVGTSGIVPFEMDTPLGKETTFRIADLDEETLREIAKVTGGTYSQAADTMGLKKIFDSIDRLEKTRIAHKVFIRYKELFPLFVIWGVIVLVLAEVMMHTLLWKVP